MDDRMPVAMARVCARGVAVAVVLGAVAGCDQAQTSVPPTVIVNNPPADGGQLVLVTVLIGVVFVVAAAAVVCGWGWACERRARRETEAARRRAEDVVLALTGRPITQAGPGVFAASADAVRSAGRTGLGGRPTAGEITGWSE